MSRSVWLSGVRWLGLAVILALIAGFGGAQAGSSGVATTSVSGVRSPASSQESQSPAAPTASPGMVLRYMRVLGSAFHSLRSTISIESSYGSCTYMTSGIAYDFLQADLQLPEGAHVVGLRIWYYDSSGPNNGVVALTEYDAFATENGTHEVAVVTTSGNSGVGGEASGNANYVVRNADHAMALRWRPFQSGSSMQICTVMLIYEVPTLAAAYLPAITR